MNRMTVSKDYVRHGALAERMRADFRLQVLVLEAIMEHLMV